MKTRTPYVPAKSHNRNPAMSSWHLPTAFKTYLLTFFIFFCFGSEAAWGSHAMGGDLTFACIGNSQYQVRLTFYRDCNGIGAPVSGSALDFTYSSASCGAAGVGSFVPQPGLTEVITPICPAALDRCETGAGTFGIERYIYDATIDLSAFAGCGNDWRIEWDLCCRNAAVTSLVSPAFEDLYLSATIDNTISCNPAAPLGQPSNRSPRFNNDPTPFGCVGQVLEYNHGVVDPDGDSLVFSLAPAKGAGGIPIAYAPGYSVLQPLITAGGVSINPNTGQLTFTPSVAQVAIVAVMVEEYRNGIKIGETNRDIQVSIINCTNQLPTVSGFDGTGSYMEEAFVGSPVCFDFFSDDMDPNDSVFLSYNSGIPGAVFTSTNGMALRSVGTLCWTPTAADIGLQTFTLEATDNACDLSGKNTFGYSLMVKENVCDSVTGLFTSNVGVKTATLNWNTVPGAVGYELRGTIAGSSNFVSLILPDGNASSFDASNLASNATYVWQIRAICTPDTSLVSPWSVIDTFTTLFCPPPDSLTVTVHSATSVTLQWSQSPLAAGSWIFVLACDSSDIRIFDIFTGDSTSITLDSLQCGIKYKWVVKIGCGTLTSFVLSEFSYIDTFMTMCDTIPPDTIYKSICEGDSILIGGEFQDSAGVFIDTLVSSTGADSIVVCILTVFPGLDIDICPDQNVPIFNVPGAACDCDGKIVQMSVVYDGPAGAFVSVGPNASGNNPTAFMNVQPGDTLTAHLGDIGNEWYWAVNGMVDAEIHTSCSDDILLNINSSKSDFGSLGNFPNPDQNNNNGTFLVVGHVDDKGNICGTTDDIPLQQVCACEDKIIQISVIYDGPAGATVAVGPNSSGNNPTSFNNVQPGDTLTANLGDIGNEWYWSVNGSVDAEIHTSCSDDILNNINSTKSDFGSLGNYPNPDQNNNDGTFLVIGHVDKKSNVCGFGASFMGNQPCECDGKIVQMTVVYDGPAGATITVGPNSMGNNPTTYTNVQPGDTLCVNLGDIGNEWYWAVNGMIDAQIHTSCSDDILFNINSEKSDFGHLGMFPNPDQNSNDGTFLVIGQVDDKGNVCGEAEPQLLCPSVTVSFEVIGGTPPFTFLWSNGSSDSVLTDNICQTTTYTVTVTDVNGCFAVDTHTATVINIACDENKVTMCHKFGTSDAHTHCISIKDIQKKLHEGYVLGDCFTTFTDSCSAVTPPPPPPCDCDGKIVAMKVVYDGPSGATVDVGPNSGGNNATVYTNVQNGDTLSANLGNIGNDWYWSVNGSVDADIHTSCSDDILGNVNSTKSDFGHLGSFPNPEQNSNDGTFLVIEHTDENGNVCTIGQSLPKYVETHQAQFEAPQNLVMGIHPNPAKGVFRVSLKQLEGQIARVRMVDITGKEVFSWSVPAHTWPGYLEIDVRSAPKGAYFIELVDDQHAYTGKVILN